MNVERWGSAQDFLESQCRGRPQTLKEIQMACEKSAPNVWKEVKGLVKRGIVNVVVLSFNERLCAFYTMRNTVRLSVVHGTSTELIQIVEIKDVERAQ